ncbi:hypothetical protein HISP_17280 [Haloarcula hispanica N601]|uniref:Uncharacterized protein n=2 Tax=Haloarcula hispanica TaxID=51589 RepID=V5TSC8_HALHI|nr:MULTISPECIES: hypothetical protein [Haloarcula]AEM59082.1 hypothetical protein HAH_4411 [Haloarcula hispanica ATCC 33960]AHB67877.1 hypothetical protein HISP_17280 [Haloarcula hispanica N601]AJF24278.1 hypothetical protein SG26_00310 [Haloarcula sp. CBA1115]KAA9400862.1 hypothetical protein Har1131_19650 [Haloarcula sp. CBA1131]
MPYELDSTGTAAEQDGNETETDEGGGLESSLGMTIPEDHVGAFVAEALEDPERATTWTDIVDTMVAPVARDAWAELSPIEQATEVLSKAAEFDRRAIEHFEAVPLDGDRSEAETDIDEGLRCRRNADTFRDGVAAAYGDGRLDDDGLVDALEAAEFDTEIIARREDLIERIDSVFEIDYRPYGGTLMDDDDGPEPETEHGETW